MVRLLTFQHSDILFTHRKDDSGQSCKWHTVVNAQPFKNIPLIHAAVVFDKVCEVELLQIMCFNFFFYNLNTFVGLKLFLSEELNIMSDVCC